MIDNSNNGNSPKEHVTVRLPKDIMKQLDVLASKSDISFTTLLIHILTDYINWHCVSANAGEMSISKHIVSAMIDRLDMFAINEIAAKAAKTKIKDIVIMLTGSFTVETWILALELWVKASGFSYKHEIKNNNHLFIITFDMGRKFAYFESELFKNVFEMLGHSTEIDVTDNSVIIKTLL